MASRLHLSPYRQLIAAAHSPTYYSWLRPMVQSTAASTTHGLLWLGATVVLVLYLIFYTEDPPRRASLSSSTASSERSTRVEDDAHGDKLLPRAPKVVGAAYVVPVILILVPSSVIASSPSTKTAIHHMVLSFWTVFVSGLSFVLGALQFIPQMQMTWRLKHSGSLSIPTMCIHIPLLFILAASLTSRTQDLLEPDTAGSVKFASGIAWINHILVGCLEILILLLAVYMNHIRPRLRKPRDEEGAAINAATPPNEDTPLIEGEDVDEQQLSRAINKTLTGSRYY
ncbi:MAG: hypothetical protein Q9191_006043 [Dirinaria sp. TL-2023a]